jgi:hypothetical protein
MSAPDFRSDHARYAILLDHRRDVMTTVTTLLLLAAFAPSAFIKKDEILKYFSSPLTLAAIGTLVHAVITLVGCCTNAAANAPPSRSR